MSIFKCKMCGGTVEFEPGATVGVCDSCGTKQTLPRLDDERRANLYDRAGHFRRNNEFDKAEGIYEQILSEDTSDAEAYWSLVLCRYGVEYVEDPATRKRIPTVNRAQFTSIYDDENYRSAIQYADSHQRAIYEEEAAEINRIQKGILEISQKEDPFDVFICYKETDRNGRRTQDSVLANDLYHQLAQEGFKVFFSRITLEDKLGTAYEPYIFAALNSAKVMVVLGTKPEYFNAPWVRNEWGRYLALVKQSGGKKVLIPAYRDMDPYDLPEEFAHLQAQDMSKLGFMQDLIRGIRKIAKAEEARPVQREMAAPNAGGANRDALLRRAFMFLEDGEWKEADEYCERVLDQDPENAEAYLGKLMAELKVPRKEELGKCEKAFDWRNNYQKLMRFGDRKLVSELKGYIEQINERNEEKRLTGIYDGAVAAMQSAKDEDAYRAAAESFKTIPGFKDADALVERCQNLAEEKREEKRKEAIYLREEKRKEAIYFNAKTQMAAGTIEGYETAIKIFQEISGWKDTAAQVSICESKIEQIKAKEKRHRKIMIIGSTALLAIIMVTGIIAPALKYSKAKKLQKDGEYKAAYTLFRELGKRKDAASCKYSWAMALLDTEEYDQAYEMLESLGESEVIKSSKYDRAIAMIDSKDYETAYNLLDGLNYKDSVSIQEGIRIQYQIELIAKAKFGSYVTFGSYEQDGDPSNGKEAIEWIVLAKENDRVLLISRYALDCLEYNDDFAEVIWETCSLRGWLRGTFVNNAFSSDEQKYIVNSTIKADNYDLETGSETEDMAFVLGIEEVNKYLQSGNERKCKGTAYCHTQGAGIYNNNCCWWLRNVGANACCAAYVHYDGTIRSGGVKVNSDYLAVRPAMWIHIDE